MKTNSTDKTIEELRRLQKQAEELQKSAAEIVNEGKKALIECDKASQESINDIRMLKNYQREGYVLQQQIRESESLLHTAYRRLCDLEIFSNFS